jgi:hypothetical protein
VKDTSDQGVGWRVVSAEEGRALFDGRARETVGMSGDEFIRRWDAGEFRPVACNTPEGRKINRLVMLMPFGRMRD